MSDEQCMNLITWGLGAAWAFLFPAGLWVRRELKRLDASYGLVAELRKENARLNSELKALRMMTMVVQERGSK